MATDLDIGALFPPLAEELGEHAALLDGEVLNAGAGHRDLRSLVPGRVHNQDIPEGLHNEDIDILSPLHEIPVEDGFFDAIVCNAVLEHVANPEQVMAEFARVCKPGGLLYLCVPFMQPEHLDPTDFQRYTRDGLKLLAERHGFDVQSAEGVHNVYVTLGWIAREWLTASDGRRFRLMRRLLFPWLARKARTSKLQVHTLASAYRVVGIRCKAEDSERAGAPGTATTCFLHVPKSGGQSIRQSLEAALPEGSLSPRGIDEAGCRILSDYSNFDQVPDWIRSQIAVGEDEVESLAEHRAVTGHFMLETLLRVTAPARIATLLREPRARLLSLYLFLRTPLMREVWDSYCGEVLSSASRPLEAFLAQPRIARATDNQVCRMILHRHPRVPDEGFIAQADVEALASATLEQLDQLGFVGVLESGAAAWHGLGEMFGVALEPVRVNESSTPEASVGAGPVPAVDLDAALKGIELRTAVDRIVYETILARTCGGPNEAQRLADAAFTQQLERFQAVRDASMVESAQADLVQLHPGGGRADR
jgi:SAM-dependent methyltransferase